MNKAIRSFSAGEIAPTLHARTDLARYEIGLRTCRNWAILRQGGATKRPGTQFIASVKDSTRRVRLFPFVFSVGDALVMEFGHRYVRFYQNAGQVVDDTDAIYEVVSPYAEADLPGLQLVQAGDVVTVVHHNYPPYELTRTSDTSWAFAPIVFGPDISPPTSVTTADLFSVGMPTTPDLIGGVTYAVTAISATGQESLAGTSNLSMHRPIATWPQRVTGTATGAVTYNVYRQDATQGVFGFIGSGIGTTIDFEDAGIVPDPTLQPPIDKSSTLFSSAGNYPACVAYYQQRLLFANTLNHPDTVWASRIAQFHNFNISFSIQDDDAITFRLISDEVDAVRHLINLGRLIICTEGAEWLVEGDGNGVLTPVAINARAGSYNGLSALKPVKTDNRLVFVQALGAAIRDAQSNVQFGTYSLQGSDLTLYSTHLFDGFAIVDWVWQQTPLHILWLVRSDGMLLGCTYIPEQDVLAWHRHDTDGFVENVCVIPEGTSHWLYVVVRRRINGSDRRYVERMTTTNVAPVFATPEAAAQGGVFTPPPPPPPPPPSPTPVVPPTAPSTTDIGTTGATANWRSGDALAETSVEIRPQGASDTAWVAILVAAGLQSQQFTGLTPNVAYEWRAAHRLGNAYSAYLGPVAATQFTTLNVTQSLQPPAFPPTVTDFRASAGFTDLTIEWPTPPLSSEFSTLQIAGPSTTAPLESAYVEIGDFLTSDAETSTAFRRITATGSYWLRVRYSAFGFAPSDWAGPQSVFVSVLS